MKIITREGNNINRCLIQVRDINYLSERYGFGSLKRILLGKDTNNKKEYEFVEIRNKELAGAIDQNQFIVDFTEMAKYDAFALSRMIFLTHTIGNTGKQHLDDQKRVEDLQDIISFNEGKLPYQIPVLFDDKITLVNEDVTFGSCTIPGYYMIKRNKKDLDLNEYFRERASSLFGVLEIEGEMESYTAIEVDNYLLVKFKTKKRKLTKKRITA